MAIIMLLVPVGCSKKEAKEVVNVYNFGEYIDGLIEKFEEETGIKVVYDTFINEDLYIRLKQDNDNYDVAFSSDYMIEKLVKEG